MAVPFVRQSEKITEDRQALFGSDTFGVKLYAMHWVLAMRQRHDKSVLGFGCDLEDGHVSRATISE
jgi:hypothetical protein